MALIAAILLISDENAELVPLLAKGGMATLGFEAAESHA